MSSNSNPITTAPLQPGNIPEALRSRDQYLMWDCSADSPRRPHWGGDFAVSWSDPDEWQSFTEAVELASQKDSWGIGYVTAVNNSDHPTGMVSVIDIDGGADENDELKEWVPSLKPFFEHDCFAEWSPSHAEKGDSGLHIPVVGTEVPEWFTDTHLTDDEHEGVDLLTNKFCTMTGDRVEDAGDELAKWSDEWVRDWLAEVYTNLKGKPPNRSQTLESASKTKETHPDNTENGDSAEGEWLDETRLRDALSHVDPDTHYSTWRDVGFALVDHLEDKEDARQLYKEWSKGKLQNGDGAPSKWDQEAPEKADRIIDNAKSEAGEHDVTIATVVDIAQDNGWRIGSNSEQAADTEERRTAINEPGGGQDNTDNQEGELAPWEVIALAGLGEDGEIADLTDRQKAACVWELVKRSSEYHIRVAKDNDSLWTYNEGLWQPTGERALRHAARKALGSMNYGQNILTELKAQARSDPTVEIEVDQFGLDPGYIAVENGLVDLRVAVGDEQSTEIRELKPEDKALTRLPVEYDATAEYDEWEEYVEEWVEDGRADAIQEYVGYCLHVGELPIDRALLLVGSGANGKSTFLSVIRAVLGQENTTSIELQTLANEQNAVADFHGSLANIDEDLSARKLGNGLGMFKKLTAGNTVRARKLYEEGFEFDAVGKHMYAANEVPQVDVPDDDEAFWRRWLLVEFPNHYPPTERDHKLSDKLTEAGSLSGVLNWAIEGWHRVIEQGYFTGEKQYAQAKRELWQAWGDSVDKFINDCIERDSSAANVSTSDVHRVYAAWCRNNDERPASQQKLTAELKNEDLDYAKRVRPGGTGTPTRGFKSLSFTDEAPDVDDTPERGSGQQQLG